MTNSIPPDVQKLLDSLPPPWQHTALIVVLLLMILGRIVRAYLCGAGGINAILAPFLGSSHAAPAPPKPVTPPAPTAPQPSTSSKA